MTETQTPCPHCGDTGFVPPLMDDCVCGARILAQLDAVAEAFADDRFPPTPAVGTMYRSTDPDTLHVFTGSEWKPVPTETLTAAEYAAKHGVVRTTDMIAETTAAAAEADDDFFTIDLTQAEVDRAKAANWIARRDRQVNLLAEMVLAGDVAVEDLGLTDNDVFESDTELRAAVQARIDELTAVADYTKPLTPTAAEAIADEIIDYLGADDAAKLIGLDPTKDPDLDALFAEAEEIEDADEAEAKAAWDEMAAADMAPDEVLVHLETDEKVTWICDKGSEHPGTQTVCSCTDDDDDYVEMAPVTLPDYAAKVVGRPMTEAQEKLMRKLLAERNPDAHPIISLAQARLDTGTLDAKSASSLIDKLLLVPADPARKAPRSNSYDGTCVTCKGNVAAGTGRIEKVDGRWKTFHLSGGCLSVEDAAKAEADRVTEPGLYRHDDDGVTTATIYRVRKARTSERLYAEKVCVHVDDHHRVDFAYNAKAIHWLRKSDRLTWKEARDFGAMYGSCVACGRTLEDPRSVVQQYGATCAGNNGWPTVTKKQAAAIIDGLMTWEDATGLL